MGSESSAQMLYISLWNGIFSSLSQQLVDSSFFESSLLAS